MKAERNHSTNEWEALSIVKAVICFADRINMSSR